MKKILIILLCFLLVSCSKTLPKPTVESGLRGELGIDKNINEKTIDNYLGREDSIYRDMRMLKDDANFEAIGGDSSLSGYVKGFEVIPYPFLCNYLNLPPEVGEGYKGPSLFSYDNNEYVANYKESLSILEDIFPKDKIIFLMCGGGGYAGMTKNLLVSLGWDGNKIYNTGGYWYYSGNNKTTPQEDSSFIYHNIEFEKLTNK